MSDRYFPIRTETSCRLKWSWSTLYLNAGHTGSCHRASVSNLTTEEFDNFHNTPVKIRDRSVMLQGQWPGNGCEYCRDIEKVGGVSDRLFQIQVPNIYPDELNYDTTLTNVTPTVLEIFFSNTCNLACIYCDARLSSVIQSENKKFGGAILPELNFNYVDNRYKELVPKFWNWFEKNYKKLKRLQLLGGEPFLQRDILKLIDYFDQNPHPELEFNLVTNLMLPPDVLNPTLEKLKTLKNSGKLKRIDINVSVDCWGETQEYIRHGFNTETFEQNLLMLMEKNAFRIGLVSTVTSLSIPSMPLLAVKYNEWCKKQKIFWYMHFVLPIDNSVFDPTIVEYSYYKPHIDTMYNLLPSETWDDKTTLEVFTGIVEKLKKECNTQHHKLNRLVYYLDKNDSRRNLDWKNVFSDLYNFIETNHVV